MPELKSAYDDFLKLPEDATKEQYQAAFEKVYALRTKLPGRMWNMFENVIQRFLFYSIKFDNPRYTLDVLQTLYPDIEKSCDSQYQFLLGLHETWAMLCLKLGDEKSAYEHLKIATFYQFTDNQSFDGFEYFSFRNFSDFSFADISNNTISLSHPSKFNDPMDTILFRWNEYVIKNETDDEQKILRLLYRRVYDHLKVRCFVRTAPLPTISATVVSDPIPVHKEQKVEDVSLLMWAHYAENHTGFCAKYRFPSNFVWNKDSKSFTFTRIGNMRYEACMEFKNRNPFTVADALFAKDQIWSYENEVRIVHYDPENSEDFKLLTLPEGSLLDIYLGLKCSDTNREKMLLLLRNKSVRVFQMEIDKSDAYKLCAKRIQ